jgi:sec-independent protein translocase protein TatC
MSSSGAAVPPGNVEEPGGKMSFFEHLADLRTRLIHSVAAIVIGTFAGVGVSKYVMDFVAKPMIKALHDAHLDEHLYITHPVGYLNQFITIGIYIGLVIASPYVLYQVWLFIAPGLYKHERKAVAGFVISSVGLFLAGIAFAYYLILPYLLHFLVTFSADGPFTLWINQAEYFDFLFVVMLGIGVVFELPILIFFLALFNIVTPQSLWKHKRYAILIIAIIAAIITPTPDATTMLIFMAPMIGLYLLGIGVAWLVVRKKRATKLARESAG